MKKVYTLYKVGGCVRDKLLGVDSKDIDFAFEFSEEFITANPELSPDDFYNWMNHYLEESDGFEIFLRTADCFTTRARFPVGHQYEGLTADFVMCRKETYDDPATRKPTVHMGNLYDDLQRRDFTVNAIAEDLEGNLIDPFGGVQDLKDKILRCPIDAQMVS